VVRYLEAEIEFVLARIATSSLVLELGCGYGRVLERLAPAARAVTGIDTSLESLRLARTGLRHLSSCSIAVMNAVALGFADQSFDLVACIQNGISAFGVDRRQLLREAIRVTRPNGRVLFSSYSAGFWEERLEWFRIQAAHGLIGEIDAEATKEGVIVCRDGFRAGTVGPGEFRELLSGCPAAPEITEVDGSSLFCELRAPASCEKTPERSS
jgi:2-polyprenyl-6-hydroxyphenyl methylase/3-demethylubiquinone-9 3-methyltransferase